MEPATTTKLNVRLEHLHHRRERSIAIYFERAATLIAAVKQAGALWSKTQGCWYVQNTKAALNAIFSAFKGKAWIDMNGLRKPQGEPPTTNVLCFTKG